MRLSSSKGEFLRAPLWVGGIPGGLIVLLAIAFGMMGARMGNVPPNLDYSTARLADNSLFRVTYIASTDIIPINQMHEWMLHVQTKDGQPVEDATIKVDGEMPQNRHGLATRPQVSQNLANGDYLVEGLKFQMGGWCVMYLIITANDQTDTVNFNIMLK